MEKKDQAINIVDSGVGVVIKMNTFSGPREG